MTVENFGDGNTDGSNVFQSGEKGAFFGKTPVVQPVGADQAATGAAAPAGGTGATAGAYDTAANRNLMITLVNETRTLVNQLRSDLVTLGIIKGSA
jgi:hypothetical protein